MANYYTQLSFAVVMPKEHYDWITRFDQACEQAMCIDIMDDSVIHEIDPELEELAKDATGYEYAGISMEYMENETDPFLWIYADECANAEYIGFILQKYLQYFGIKDRFIGFEWANTCSKPRLDEFGGGAAVVSHDDMKFMNTGRWIEKTIREMDPNTESTLA